MADDHRYSWLDDKAAERLLRGEPVEGQHGTPDGRSDRPHAEAERLAAVLSAVAEEARRPDGAAEGTNPLPGEDAAVAAFRAAHARPTLPTVVPLSIEAQVGDKSTRIARPADAAPDTDVLPAPAERRDGRRWLRRPLRAGMVAAVAGCALSGFAVAAAAGVLPFGQGGGTPAPGSSVSDTGPGGGDSVRPEISQEGGAPTAPDDTGGTSEGPQGRGVPGGDEGHGKDKHGKHGKHDGRDKPGQRGKGEKGSPGAWKSGTGFGDGKNNGNGPRALGACRRYLAAEAGTGPEVDRKSLKKLKRAAGGRSTIHAYCVQLVGDAAGPRGGTVTPSGTGSTNGNDDSGSGDDGSSHPAPPPPSGDGDGTQSPEPTPSDVPVSTLSGTPSGSPSSAASDSPSTTPSDSVSTTPSDTAEASAP